MGLGGEGSGGVTSDIAHLLSRAVLRSGAKVAQLLLGSSTYRRLVTVRAELIQQRFLIPDKGGELLVGERALAVVFKAFEGINEGQDIYIRRFNGRGGRGRIILPRWSM